MRIAVDARPLLEPRPGGVPFATREIIRSLREAGADVTVWVNSSRGSRGLDRSGFEDVRVIEGRIPNKALHVGLRIFGRPHLDRLVGNPDWFLMPNANFAAFSPRARVVLVVHDLSFEVNQSWFSPRQRLWHRMVAPRRLAARADRIIAVSENTKRDIIDLYRIPEAKIVVVPPRIITFPPEAHVPRPAPSGAGPREPMLFYLGEVSRRKNILGLIRAFESLAPRFTELRLVIAGADGWGSGDVDRAIARSPVRDRISKRGAVSEEEKRDLLARAALFVYPSFYEGYGIPVVEAMSAGVPVVASHAGSLPEVVGDAGVLVDPYDVSTLREAIAALLGNPSLAASFAERGERRSNELREKSTPPRLLAALAL